MATRTRRVRPIGRWLLAVIAVATMGLAPSAAAQEPADGPPIVYQPPVDAAVVDDFRPPGHRYGAGNRGLTYDVAPGTPVRASAAGTVTFSGTVAGTLHVTVSHADGLRTSYSFLSTVAVHRGQVLAAGDPVGTGSAGFHFGVRDGDTYLDPAALFGSVEVRVRLVPHDVPPPTATEVARERRELFDLVRAVSVLDQAGDLVSATFDRAAASASAAASRLEELTIARLSTLAALTGAAKLTELGIDLVERFSQECTPTDRAVVAPSATGRVAVTVAGYGSDGTAAAVDDVDTIALGYAATDVVRYSYRGGRVPGDVSPDLADITVADYRPDDTFDDLRARGVALADLIVQASERRPGNPVDVYAHSQGGIVTRLALQELERRNALDVLRVVVTIGTPHAGADLATAGVVLGPLESRAVGAVADLVGAHVDPGATSVRQMAEYSDLIQHLARTGVPDGVDFRTVGARGDLIVAGNRTTVDGAPAAIVDLVGPSAHDALPGAPDTTRELTLALAGAPPACEGVVDTVLDALVPAVVTAAEDVLTLGLSAP